MMQNNDIKLLFLILVASLLLKTVHLQDTTPPVIFNCPLNNFVSSSPNKAFWAEPTAFDNGGSVTLTSNRISGSYFNEGQTQVIYIATDEQGLQTDCSFTVSVSVTGIPVVSNCPSSITANLATGATTATVSWFPPFATDPDVPVVRSSNKEPNDEFPVGDTTVTYTFVDSTGLGGFCEFTVTVQDAVDSDSTAPSFTYCPNDITAYAAEGTTSTSVSWTTPEATDDSGTISYTRTHEPGAIFTVGATPVLYTAYDPTGNSAMCLFTVTVLEIIPIEDSTSPTFTYCPTDITAYAPEGTTSTSVFWTTPEATDDSGTISYTRTHESGAIFTAGATPVLYTAYDPAGNSAMCLFTVTVIEITPIEDSTSPTFTYCPNDITAYAPEGTTSTSVSWTIPEATDDSGTISYTRTHESGAIFTVGATPVLYTAYDPAGNSASCLFTVTVIVTPIVDSTAPSFTYCPTDITAYAPEGTTSTSVFWTTPEAIDDSNSVSYTRTHESGAIFSVGATPVLYTAYDPTGNSASCLFTVTVLETIPIVDSTSPTFTYCPNDITAYAPEGTTSTSVSWTTPEATDDSGTISYTRTHESGAIFTVGATPVLYTAYDPTGNSASCLFTVTVIVNQRPVTSNCPSSQTLSADTGLTTTTATWTEPTFSDELGNIVPTTNIQPGATFPLGTTVISYTATDLTGLEGLCTFEIIVQDTEKPQISNCPSDVTSMAASGTTSATVTWTAPTATDNDAVASLVSNYNSPSTFPIGVRNIVYVASDPSGNFRQCIFKATVTETQLPVFVNFPTDQTVNAATGQATAVVTWAEPSVTYPFQPAPIVTSNYEPGDVFPIGITTVTYRAEDSLGGVTTDEFNVRVLDTQNPEITSCPNDITSFVASGSSSTTVTWTAPTATDNDAITSLVSNYDSPATFAVGGFSVVYVTTDPSGNTAECSFQVTIIETQAPTFVNFPADQVVNTSPGQPTAIVTWTVPSVTYTFEPAPIVTSNYEPGDVFTLGATTVTYRAEDSFGVVTTDEFIIRVIDEENPQIINCPSDITVYVAPGLTSATVTWTPPTATDNDMIVSLISNYNTPREFQIGSKEVVYVATDPAGNFDDCTFVIIVTERQPPAFVNFPSVRLANNSPGLGTGIVTWTEPTVSYSGNTAPTVVTSHQSGDTFPIGETTVTYTAVDSYGLVTEQDFTVRIIDNEAPTIENCPSPVSAYAPANSVNTVTWTAPTATDNSGSVNVISNNDSGDEFPIGVHLVTYIAIDDYNNQVSCTFVLSVREDTPPLLSNLPPSTHSVLNDPGQPGAVVTWDQPTATDDRSVPTITASHEAGAMFPIGSTMVSITAIDSQGLTDVYTFQVNVIDSEDPTISGCDDVTVTADPGQTTVRAYWTPPTATDNSGEVTVTGNASPGDEFSIGTTSIGYLAVDGFNNQAMCAVNIIVRELGYPVFSNCPSAIFVETDPGEDEAIVSWDTIIATDELGGPTVTSNYDSGSTFSVGTTTVIYNAIDSDGLSATCSFDVSVSDLEDPVIINCPSDISLHIVDSSKSARVWWMIPVATDNLGDVEISSTNTPGDSFPEGESIVLYVAQDSARNSVTCLFSVRLLIPLSTLSYNSSVSLDRIGGNTISSNSDEDVLQEEVTSDLDTYLRSTTIGDKFVGVDDSILAISNSLGIAAVEFTLHMTQDSSYSTARIEDAFDDDLSSSGAFTSGNRVVQSSFLVGPGECGDDPCDRGTCERVGRNDFYCSCPSGWSGFRCSNDENECEEDPCGELSMC
ncbi:hyalin-like isoform X2 [Amphiura filiformis]|uniref:hyalin-like isoform X2 n=1 Tax=Amphiura filiformis TaxID=82378 RepID=UPI003B227CEC